MTEVTVIVLTPYPLAPLEDMVTLVAAMANAGVAANADESEHDRLNAKRNPRAIRRRDLCMAGTFP